TAPGAGPGRRPPRPPGPCADRPRQPVRLARVRPCRPRRRPAPHPRLRADPRRRRPPHPPGRDPGPLPQPLPPAPHRPPRPPPRPTADVHAHNARRAFLQDTLVAIRLNTTLDACERDRRGNREAVLRTPAEMAARFPDDAVRGALEVADRCRFDLTSDLGYSYP